MLIGADLGKTVWSKGKNLPEGAAGAGISVRLWVVNDEHRAIDGVACEVRLRGQGRDVLVGSSRVKVQIPADAVMDLPGLSCTLPAEVAPGAYELVLTLKQGEKVLSENSYSIAVVE